ncbi:MAG TPA: glycosyltransferase [Gemmatimonadales bacterium]|nr:glycosyltransferase [Gemmatimonadales bacterium]
MRVLHVLAAFPRSSDDVIAPWLVELLQRLRTQGVAVEVFTSAYKGGGNREFDGIPVHRFRYAPAGWERLTHEEAAHDRMRRSWLFRILPLWYVLGGAMAIRRLCRRERYDVIHVHWPLPHAVFGWVGQRTGGAAIVTTFYGVEFQWARRPGSFFSKFLAWSARISQAVVAISTHTARRVAALAPDTPVRVIPYTVALPPAGHREPGAPGVFQILFVGRLVERKGVRYLLEALARLPQRVGARLEVVGDGPERPALEALGRQLGLTERVVWRGWVSKTELQEAYARAGAFVLPAVVDARGDTEGLGVVLLEAMNERVPVIASEVGGITDIVKNDETGLLVPPGDPDALAAALLKLALDASAGIRLSERGYRLLQEQFTWDAIVPAWLGIYAEAAAARGRAKKTN